MASFTIQDRHEHHWVQDFFDTFSPMVKPTTVRLLLALAISSGWVIRHLDVYNVFLNGNFSETMYMKQPPGYIDAQTIKCDDGILLSQQRYMTIILKRDGMIECKALSTPISISKSVPFSADLYDDHTQYRSLA
ncbi:uncharacterized protein LOC116005735 [Ipomoea triloba]|uniref:uncharacterized protein LOC116005735 n=1 Tax=Ipomoea triloba TaxID=35885 RepID=UPI00125E57A3|nr:uncharacterized protein LOC116005735 [Ipomoea triloba]